MSLLITHSLLSLPARSLGGGRSSLPWAVTQHPCFPCVTCVCVVDSLWPGSQSLLEGTCAQHVNLKKYYSYRKSINDYVPHTCLTTSQSYPGFNIVVIFTAPSFFLKQSSTASSFEACTLGPARFPCPLTSLVTPCLNLACLYRWAYWHLLYFWLFSFQERFKEPRGSVAQGHSHWGHPYGLCPSEPNCDPEVWGRDWTSHGRQQGSEWRGFWKVSPALRACPPASVRSSVPRLGRWLLFIIYLLAALCLHCCTRAFSSFGESGLL